MTVTNGRVAFPSLKRAYRHKIAFYIDPEDFHQDMVAPMMSLRQVQLMSDLVQDALDDDDLTDREVRAYRALLHRFQSCNSRLMLARRHVNSLARPRETNPTPTDIAIWLVRALLQRVDTNYIKRNFAGVDERAAQQIHQVIEDVYIKQITMPREPETIYFADVEIEIEGEVKSHVEHDDGDEPRGGTDAGPGD